MFKVINLQHPSALHRRIHRCGVPNGRLSRRIVPQKCECPSRLNKRVQQIISNSASKARLRSSRKQAQQKQDNDEQNDEGRVTLSGLINFTDGLWSCCGDERPGAAALQTHGRPRQPRHLRSPHLPAAGKELLGARCPPTLRSSRRVREVGRGTHAGPGGRDFAKEQRDADVAMKNVVLAMQARINLGVGGGSRDQLAELYTSCDDQTVNMRLSSDKVVDNIPAIGNPVVGYNANYGNPKSCREWENEPIAPRL